MIDKAKGYLYLIDIFLLCFTVIYTTVVFLGRMGNISPLIIAIWYLMIIGFLFIFVFLTITYKSIAFLFNLAFMVIGIFILFAMVMLYFYNTIFFALLVFMFAINKYKEFPYRFLLIIIAIVLGCILLFFVAISFGIPYYWFNFTTIFTTLLNFLGILYMDNRYEGKILKKVVNVTVLKFVFVIMLVIGFISVLPTEYVVIDTNNDVNITFWTSADGLPDDTGVLDLCYQNNISFCVVLKTRYLEDDTNELTEIKRVLENKVSIYVSIAANDTSYLTYNTIDDVYNTFIYVRNWLITENLYNYSNFKGFVFDAESDLGVMELFRNMETIERLNYVFYNIPTRQQVEYVENKLNDMVNIAHNDNKLMGLVIMPTYYDEIDGDKDIAMYLRNVYGLDVNFDFSVSMCYRTVHVPTVFNIFLNDIEYFHNVSTDLEIEYFQQDVLEQNIVPQFRFYYIVQYELSGSPIGIENREDRHIFIGTFWDKFSSTSYIINKEYQEDVDICRQLGTSQVWMYYYIGFTVLYGERQGLEDLINYLSQRQTWYLQLPYFYLNRDILLGYLVVMLDAQINIL